MIFKFIKKWLPNLEISFLLLTFKDLCTIFPFKYLILKTINILRIFSFLSLIFLRIFELYTFSPLKGSFMLKNVFVINENKCSENLLYDFLLPIIKSNLFIFFKFKKNLWSCSPSASNVAIYLYFFF